MLIKKFNKSNSDIKTRDTMKRIGFYGEFGIPNVINTITLNLGKRGSEEIGSTIIVKAPTGDMNHRLYTTIIFNETIHNFNKKECRNYERNIRKGKKYNRLYKYIKIFTLNEI